MSDAIKMTNFIALNLELVTNNNQHEIPKLNYVNRGVVRK